MSTDDSPDSPATAQDHWSRLGALALADVPVPLPDLLATVQALVCAYHHERLVSAPVPPGRRRGRSAQRGRPGAIQATASALGIGRPLVRKARDEGLPPWLLDLVDPPRVAPPAPRGAPARARKRRAA